MTTRLVSLDLGRSHTKAVSAKNLDGASLPSAVTPYDASDEVTAFGVGGEQTVTADGVTVAVGDSAFRTGNYARKATRRDMLAADERRRLFYAALGELYERSGDLEVVASVPGGWWKNKDEYTDMLAGHHEFNYCDRDLWFDVHTVRPVPEGLGSLCQYVLSTDGRTFIDRRMAEGTVAVVDCGGRTTDTIGFDGLHLIPKSVDSRSIGIIDCRDKLRKTLGDELDRADSTLDDNTLDDVILTNYLGHKDKDLDVGEFVDVAVSKLADDVLDMFDNALEGGVEYKTVLLTGGGAPLIGPRILDALDHGDVRWPDRDAWLFNSRGGYRYGLFARVLEGPA